MAAPLIFDKYEIIRRIAIGGMGEIFLARQTGIAGFDRLVILKSMLPDLIEQESAVEEFLAEAKVAATLSHPNVIAIYEVGRWQGSYFIAMEYVPGENLMVLLQALSKAKAKVPFDVSAQIVHDAAVGLDFAHHACDSQGRALHIVHRDVSPHNIMVSTSGATKVVDFGIASAANRESQTRTGVIKGKIRYMAPEQVDGSPIDARADQFALGVVLWEMITGRRMFPKGANDLAAIQTLLSAPITPPSKHDPTLPPELERVVMKMLSRDRVQRYERCLDVATDLAGFIRAQPEAGPKRVGVWVEQVIGERVKERVRDLSPGQDNFLISFQGPAHAAMQRMPTRTAEGGLAPARKYSGPNLPDPTSEEVLEPSEAQRLERPRSIPVRTFAAPAASSVWPRALFFSILGFSLAGGLLWYRKHNPPQLGPQPLPVQPVKLPELSADPVPTPTVLVIDSTPRGALIELDGEFVGRTPLTRTTVAPGVEHSLVLSLGGYGTNTLAVRLEPGQRREVLASLAKLSEAPAPAKPPPPPSPPPRRPSESVRPVRPSISAERAPAEDGYLSLNTTPWAQVTIDGQGFGTTPLFKIALKPGSHEIMLENPGAKIVERRTINIAAGATTKLELSLGKK